ncbi:tyrosine-type recombinase/integrase [Clostridium estertheticum]|uniref:Integrase n=1 Tax=Clostridium estertheticum subsp. estertheticum TaxID=1552 RepID=A0A1J0GJP8_9CLOT|nr:tyrosine-type recombinase/integrase [Clostridium estertheticum]APC41561.1 integrase [Clostridium estertheticum subsp. estertheticum]
MQYNITYREKDGGWQYIVSYKDSNGKWKQKSKQGFEKSRIGKQQAKEEALKTIDKLNKDISLNVPSEFEGISFNEFGKSYLKHNKLYNAYKTIQSTQTVLNRFSDLDDMELSKITTLDIQKVVDTLTGEDLNPNTIKYYLKKLTIIFNAAKNQYSIIDAIPTKNIRVNKSKEINKKALTEDEVSNLLNVYKDSKYFLLVFIAAKTGMRIGEVLGLKWNDINSVDNIINVERQWKKDENGKFDFGTLKSNNSYRSIPISKSICKELLAHKNVIQLNNRIFEFENKDNVIAALDKSLKRNGFNITIHELRHTYATKLIANGMDYKTAASILGHSVQLTIKTYSHVNNDMLNKAKELIENIF